MKLNNKTKGLLIAILVGVCLILLNILFSNSRIRLDLTEESEYTLSDSTQKILKSLEDPVTIKIYFSQKVPPHIKNIHQQILDIIDEYQVTAHGLINVELIAPDESIKNEEEAQMDGIPPIQINVIEKDKQEVQKIYLGMTLIYGDKSETLPLVAEIRNLEYELTSSLLKLTAHKNPNVALITNEKDISVFTQVVQNQYMVSVHDFSPSSLQNSNLGVIILVDPFEISDTFLEELDAWEKKGVPVIIFASQSKIDSQLYKQDVDLGINKWLQKRGIEFSKELIFDPKNPGRASFSSGFVQYQIPYPFFVRVTPDGLSKNNPMTQKLEELIFPWVNALRIDEKEKKNIEILANSTASSFLENDITSVRPEVLEQIEMKPGESYPLAVYRSVIDDKTKNKTKLIVVASSHLLKDNLIRNFQTNALFVQNILDWSVYGDDLVGIGSRGKTTRPIEGLTSNQMSFIRWSFMLGLPILVITLSFFLRLKRFKKWHRLNVSDV